jgi:hypothetical protein
MAFHRNLRLIAAFFIGATLLAACGGPPSEPFSDRRSFDDRDGAVEGQTRLFDLFTRGSDETSVAVNRYIWAASLEVLDFLPLQSVDPFSGVIVTGFGTPPNGGRAYRATVLIQDAALEARSLNIALQTRNGPASAATIRAVEDAILTRARQIRTRDSRF